LTRCSGLLGSTSPPALRTSVGVVVDNWKTSIVHVWPDRRSLGVSARARSRQGRGLSIAVFGSRIFRRAPLPLASCASPLWPPFAHRYSHVRVVSPRAVLASCVLVAAGLKLSRSPRFRGELVFRRGRGGMTPSPNSSRPTLSRRCARQALVLAAPMVPTAWGRLSCARLGPRMPRGSDSRAMWQFLPFINTDARLPPPVWKRAVALPDALRGRSALLWFPRSRCRPRRLATAPTLGSWRARARIAFRMCGLATQIHWMILGRNPRAHGCGRRSQCGP
jgi:hypothetical protein